MSTTEIEFADIENVKGRDLGFTEYRTVTQEQVDTFADATDDHQWIHTDPERAKSSPFGGPIAHGFLTLSLAIPFWTELLEVKGVATKINYGLDKVRFPAPVRVGARVRMTATVADVVILPGGVQLSVDQVIEIEGQPKPAVVARGLYRFYA